MLIDIEQGKKFQINNMILDNNNNNNNNIIMHVIDYEPHENEVREVEKLTFNVYSMQQS